MGTQAPAHMHECTESSYFSWMQVHAQKLNHTMQILKNGLQAATSRRSQPVQRNLDVTRKELSLLPSD